MANEGPSHVETNFSGRLVGEEGLKLTDLSPAQGSHDAGLSRNLADRRASDPSRTVPSSGLRGYGTSATYQATPIAIEENEDEEYVPIQPPAGYPPLDFKPLQLQRWFLVSSLLFMLGCDGAVIGLVVLSKSSPGLFRISNDLHYNLYRYIPGVIGTLTTLLWRSIAQTYNRIVPYITMASMASKSNDYNHKAFRSAYALGHLSGFMPRPVDHVALFKERHFLTIIINTTSLLVIPFLTPLKNSFIAIQVESSGWFINVSASVGYSLISLYFLLSLATTCILIRTYSITTGLKWDPASFASQIALVNKSNIFEAFHGLEFADYMELKQILRKWNNKYGVLRLGYWASRGNEKNIVHGIRFLKEDTGNKRPQLRSRQPDNSLHEHGRVSNEASGTYQEMTQHQNRVKNSIEVPTNSFPEPGEPRRSLLPSDYCQYHCHGNRYSCPRSPYSIHEMPLNAYDHIVCGPEFKRYRDIYFQLTDLGILVFAAVAISCISVGAVILANGRLDRGFTSVPYRGGANITSGGDLPRMLAAMHIPGLRMLYIFLPSFLIGIFSFVWLPADNLFRTMQPLAVMDGGGSANETILLEYITDFSPLVVWKAMQYGHWRVAWFTALALFSSAAPIIAGGIFKFTSSKDSQTSTHVFLSRSNFYGSFAIFCTYLISLIFARPPMRFLAPRAIVALPDLISYCYDTELIRSPDFSVQDPTDQEEHLKAKIHLAKRRYEFGLYLGGDGRRHIGFEIAEKLAKHERLFRPVEKFLPPRAISSGFAMWYLRAPQILSLSRDAVGAGQRPYIAGQVTNVREDRSSENAVRRPVRRRDTEITIDALPPIRPGARKRWPRPLSGTTADVWSRYSRPEVARDPAMTDGIPDPDMNEQ